MRWFFVAAVAVVIGCGGGTSAPSGIEDSGVGAGGGGGEAGHAGSMNAGAAGAIVDAGVVRDAGRDAEAGACVPEMPIDWSPRWTPPRIPTPNACTKTQIDRRYAVCEDPVTYDQALCNAFKRDPINAACQACLFSTEDESSWGPIVIKRNGVRDANVAGCIALVEGNLSVSGCGAKHQASVECPEFACFDDCLTYDSFFACEKPAREGICKNYEAGDVCADSPAYAACTSYSVFKDYFSAIGRLFCATGFPDAGIFDAGGAGETGAPRDANPAQDSGGPDACVSISDGGSETIYVPACGYNPASSARGYGGGVLMTVRGILVNNGNESEDAFYYFGTNDTTNPLGACPDCIHYSRLSEGSCVCLNYPQCPSHRLSDLLAEPYPAFNPTHEYTVKLDLGATPPERLNFGMSDCGCDDNSGTLVVSLTPLGSVAVCGP